MCVCVCVCVCVCMCVWHVWLVLCMQVAGKGVPAWPDIPKQQGNQLGNLTPADRHGSVQVSQMWTPYLILSKENGRLQTLIWVVTPCCLVVDVNISKERAAFVSESQDAMGCIGWVRWRADEMLPKPVEAVSVTIYWFAVASVSFSTSQIWLATACLYDPAHVTTGDGGSICLHSVSMHLWGTKSRPRKS